jgi:RNA polymerase-interacting CarD/CdnL/TRCF family regulator
MKFHVDEAVMHWTYGFGHVVGIEERMLFDHKIMYYAVQVHNMTVWVPADDQLETRLRTPTLPENFKVLFEVLTSVSEPLPSDPRERKYLLTEELKDGQAGSLCRVLRDLSKYEQTHKLNYNDENLMKQSRAALLDEWSYALSIPVEKANWELRNLLSVETAGNTKKS